MSVTVMFREGTSNQIKKTHENGRAFMVDQTGHLHVFDAHHNNAKRIAAYAPDYWHWATADNDEAP